MITIRAVTENDCSLLWQWANDNDVRRSAFNTDLIAWTDHCHWFKKSLTNKNRFIYIGNNEANSPVGQVRFDIVNKMAEIDFSIDKKFRGSGFGKELLKLGIGRVVQETNVQALCAEIKVSNLKSLNCFKDSFFEFQGEVDIDGETVLRYNITRTNVLRRLLSQRVGNQSH